ncbi:hypothetical protein FJT64_016827 [Amphibalanus amphitrite]|uniref:Alpha-N-acetylglucosaminidase C-terminal domain-containing protein n=1 Tax=Amphibalanus amphitrite TaxID=1232801 RepID=A0A6A4WZK3_AMPAM|nr:hypothetical protein FJT64_016827 [Amphibalanus amphitrite]
MVVILFFDLLLFLVLYKTQSEDSLWYNSSDLTAAWDRLVAGATADQVRAAANLRHDLVDVTREVLTGLLTAYHGRLVGAFSDNNIVLLR